MNFACYTESYSLRHCNRGSCDVCVVIHVPLLLLSVFSKFILSDYKLSAMPPQGISWTKELSWWTGAICMYVWINSESTYSVEVFLSLEKHFMKVVCCVQLSKSCPKVFVECHSFVFFWGTICTIQSLFCKGYLSSSLYNHQKTEYFVHHETFAFDLCICFLIYYVLYWV
jgi:hypothetical protein